MFTEKGLKERLASVNIHVKNERDGKETVCEKCHGHIKTLEKAFLVIDNWEDNGNITQLDIGNPKKVFIQSVSLL